MPPPAPSPSHGDPPAPTIVELGRRPLHSSDRVVRPYGLSWGNRLSPSRCHPSREPSSPRLIERDRNLSVRTLLSTATFPHGRPSIESLDLDHRCICSDLCPRHDDHFRHTSPQTIFPTSRHHSLFVSSFLPSFPRFFLSSFHSPLFLLLPSFLFSFTKTTVSRPFVSSRLRRGSRSVTKLAHSLHRRRRRRLTYYIARHDVVAKKRRTKFRGEISPRISGLVLLLDPRSPA